MKADGPIFRNVFDPEEDSTLHMYMKHLPPLRFVRTNPMTEYMNCTSR